VGLYLLTALSEAKDCIVHDPISSCSSHAAAQAAFTIAMSLYDMSITSESTHLFCLTLQAGASEPRPFVSAKACTPFDPLATRVHDSPQLAHLSRMPMLFTGSFNYSRARYVPAAATLLLPLEGRDGCCRRHWRPLSMAASFTICYLHSGGI